MDKQFGEQIQGMLGAERPDVQAVLDLIGGELKKDAREAVRGFVALTEAVVRAQDLRGAIACVAFYDAHAAELREGKGIDLAQMREVVRRSASTTDEKLFVDSIGLNSAIAKAIVSRLSVLLALKPGVYVSSQSWGFGQVQSLDTFYGKVIIDFEGKKGHAMSLAVAGQSLSVADDEHLMTRYLKNREEIKEMAQKHPAELVRLALQSYGAMSVQRLAERLAQVGLVAPKDWKGFWEAARRGLKADKAHPVEIPAKRTAPIRLLEEEEDFGDKWLRKFAKERDLNKIYDGTLALLAEKNGELPDSYRDVIGARLNFALKGADKTDFARYAQVAVLLRRLNLSTAEEQQRQAETLTEKDEQDNFLASMKGLAARDVSALVAFLLAAKPELKALVLAHLPALNSVALGATLATLKGDEEAGAAVRALLACQKSPFPTLVVWALRNRADAEAWRVPALNELVTQAIHIVEQRLTGEELKMRNALQAFFDSAKWLEGICKELTAFDRTVMFERIQASRSWDAASQKTFGADAAGARARDVAPLADRVQIGLRPSHQRGNPGEHQGHRDGAELRRLARERGVSVRQGSPARAVGPSGRDGPQPPDAQGHGLRRLPDGRGGDGHARDGGVEGGPPDLHHLGRVGSRRGAEHHLLPFASGGGAGGAPRGRWGGAALGARRGRRKDRGHRAA